jgi:DNA-binding PadR family transcriptional regulator
VNDQGAAEPGVGLNPTAASLLGFLHAGELSGYELVGVAEDRIGDFWHVTRSQVYRELAVLARRGLIEAGTVGARAKRPYRLTQAGREAFAQWVARPPEMEQIRYPLLLTLAFGSWLGPEPLLEFMASHRAVHEERLAGYREKAADEHLDPYERATFAFGIRYEEAVLAWADELPVILAGAARRPAGRGQEQMGTRTLMRRPGPSMR